MIEMWFDDEFKPVKPKSLKQGRPRKRGRRNFFSPIISDDYKNVRLVIAAAFLQLLIILAANLRASSSS